MKSSLKIIHLDGSYEGASAVKESLNTGKRSAEIRLVRTRQEFLAAISNFHPDIIISEYSLPDIHCSQALDILREKRLEIPFLVFSNAISDDMAEEMLCIGADDYIIKDQAGRLPFAVLRSLEKYRFKQEQQNLLRQLTDGEKWFRTLVENSTDAVVVFNMDGQPRYASPAVKNVLGYSPEEIIDMNIFTKGHPDDFAAVTKVMEKVLVTPGVTIPGHTGRMLHKDGTWRWIEATITNLLHEPAVNGIVDNFRDVTDKKLSEAKILHLNRLYAFLSQVNHTLVHASDSQTVFSEVCRIAIETGKFHGAWIGMFADDNSKMNVAEHRGISRELLTSFANATNEQAQLTTILESEDYYVSNNIRNQFISEQWKTMAFVAGYQSCMVLPIKRSGNIVGIFNLYASQTDAFTQAEITLLEEAAAGISFSLDLFEKERLKVLADEQLQHKERRLSQAQAVAHLGSWETDLATDSSVWSEEACRIYGLSQNDNFQSDGSWLSFVHPQDLEYVIECNRRVLECMHPVDYYHRIIRTDGQVRYLHVQTHVELNSQGKPEILYGVLHDVTEKEKSQQALKSSESSLRAIFENTSEGFILTDQHAIIRHYNSKARYFYRLNTGKELSVGDSLFDVITQHKRANFRKAITSVLSGAVWQYEHRYKNSDGTKKWFNITVNPVHENHLITGLSLTITDITDYKLAQDQLHKSESNLNAIMNNTDALIYSLDLDYKYITCNHAHRKMMTERYDLDVYPGFDLRKHIHKFDLHSVLEWEQIRARVLAGEAFKFEIEKPVNGIVSHFKLSLHPIRKNAEITGFSCFVDDITREKQADEKVLEALKERNVILESIGDGFYALDKDWIVTYWNKEAELMLNTPKETILGQSLWTVFPDVVDSNIYLFYQRAAAQNTIQHFETFYKRDNTWFEINAYPSENGLSVYFRNVTKRKEAESQLKELNENLRTYTNELIEANKGLEQFSYIVSHNLRAPVANVIGLAKLISEDIYTPDVKEQFLDGILLNINRLDDVISDLNAILQIKREVSENKEVVNIQLLVDTIQSSVKNIIEKEQVKIKTDFSMVPELFTLKSYLHSIFYNLIMNSVKYRRPDQAPVICIRTGLENGQVIISFRDNGMGIDLQKRGKQIFGLYKRFHQHVEGKGMGLFMVKTQVEMLGGKIHVKSALNEGTEFKIEFRSNEYQTPVS